MARSRLLAQYSTAVDYPESMEQTERGSSNVAVSTVAIVLSIYFLFPHALLVPFLLATRKSDPPAMLRAPVEFAFAPIRYLVQRVPPYAWLIRKESDLTGIH